MKHWKEEDSVNARFEGKINYWILKNKAADLSKMRATVTELVLRLVIDSILNNKETNQTKRSLFL